MRNRIGLMIIAAAVFAALLSGCAGQDTVAFARRVFNGLIDGRFGVRSSIDWANLKMMGIETGAVYASLQTDSQRADFERSFIESFSRGYKEQGATKKAFSNWRLGTPAEDPKIKYVLADCRGQDYITVFSVRQDGFSKKLVAMSTYKVLDQAAPAGSPAAAGQKASGQDVGKVAP